MANGAPKNLARSIAIKTEAGESRWQVAEEVPVALVYNQRNYAVMLASPADLDDFAIGFSISERIINHPGECISCRAVAVGPGFNLHIELTQERLDRFDVRQNRRSLVGTAGCGLCGLENFDHFEVPLPKFEGQKNALSSAVIKTAILNFSQAQKLNQQTRSVHGAAWCSPQGDIIAVREDVGRHNAVDKLLGARAVAEFEAGFLLVSSRCSYEIVEKAARHNVGQLVSISAPTGLAIDRAKQANISLYSWAGQHRVLILE